MAQVVRGAGARLRPSGLVYQLPRFLAVVSAMRLAVRRTYSALLWVRVPRSAAVLRSTVASSSPRRATHASSAALLSLVSLRMRVTLW